MQQIKIPHIIFEELLITQGIPMNVGVSMSNHAITVCCRCKLFALESHNPNVLLFTGIPSHKACFEFHIGKRTLSMYCKLCYYDDVQVLENSNYNTVQTDIYIKIHEHPQNSC